MGVNTTLTELESAQRLALEICANSESYKRALQEYHKKGKDRLREEQRRLADKYEELIGNIVKGISKIDSISDELLELFTKPSGFGEALGICIGFNRTQLRKLFSEIKRLQLMNLDDDKLSLKLSLIVPKIAYARGRKLIDEEFYKLLKTLIEKVKASHVREQYRNFVQIFEAIVAFHTYYHPTEV